MSHAEDVCTLIEDIRRLVYRHITPDGDCMFDHMRVKMALEFARLEIQKSLFGENGEID